MFEVLKLRRNDGTDRAGVDRAVGMTAGFAVDGTDVQTRAAADAGKGLALALVMQLRRATVVEEDDMEGAGTVPWRDTRPE